MPLPQYEVVDLRKREGIWGFTKRSFPKVAFGLSPLWVFFGGWCVMCSYSIYHAFSKNEIQVNRSTPIAPWEWQRAKEEFEKRKHILVDNPKQWKRIPELDAIMDEMVAAESKL